MTKLSLTYPKI